jgi:hypothetical protein
MGRYNSNGQDSQAKGSAAMPTWTASASVSATVTSTTKAEIDDIHLIERPRGRTSSPHPESPQILESKSFSVSVSRPEQAKLSDKAYYIPSMGGA